MSDSRLLIAIEVLDLLRTLSRQDQHDLHFADRSR